MLTATGSQRYAPQPFPSAAILKAPVAVQFIAAGCLIYQLTVMGFLRERPANQFAGEASINSALWE